jgi:hypothetical protein
MVVIPETPGGGTHTVEEIFEATARQTELTLEAMPHNLLEARRTITKELGIRPTAEQLQTIVKMAHESPLEDPIAELPKSFLRMLVRGHRALHSVHNSRPLDPDALRLDGEIILRVLDQAERLDEELNALVTVAENLSPDARNFLLQAGDALRVPRDELLAALVLVPKLQQFAGAVSAESLQQAAPSLSEGEVQVILDALSEEDEVQMRPPRVCVDALALRSLILEDLERWIDIGSRDKAPEGALDSVRAELNRDQEAYRVISDHLQTQQDATLVADLHESAEEIRTVGRSLFSTYLKLAHALNEGDPSQLPDDAAIDERSEEFDRLLQQVADGDREAVAAAESKVTEDELYLNALKDVKEPERKPVQPVGAEDLRRDRKRLAVLAGVASALAAVSLVLNFVLFGTRPAAEIDLAAEDFSPAAPVGDVTTLGPVVFAEVDSWDGLKETERENQTLRIGQQASARGATAVFLRDEDGKLAGTWSRDDGVRIIDAEMSAEPR